MQEAGNTGEHLNPLVVERLSSRAGGNPFYIEELLNYMHDRGLDPRDPHSYTALDLPDDLSSLILSRIDRLSEPQRSTLKVREHHRTPILVSLALGSLPDVRRDNGGPYRSRQHESSRPHAARPARPTALVYFSTRPYPSGHVQSQPYAARAELHGQLGNYLEDVYAGDIERNVDLLRTTLTGAKSCRNGAYTC